MAKSNQKITRALRALGDFLITFLATRGIIANIHSSPVKEPYIITWVNLPKKIRENAEPIFFYCKVVLRFHEFFWVSLPML